MSKECDRRTFMTSSLGASTTGPPTKPIPKRPLGKTGYQVTIYGLGGLFTTSMNDRHAILPGHLIGNDLGLYPQDIFYEIFCCSNYFI
ncbi:hypothetical protein ACFL7M_06080 [Thermodesulfobacteriota bacterium]